MNIIEIEKKLNYLVENFNKETFIFTLLEAYDFPKTTITKAKKSELNKLTTTGSFTVRKKVFFLQTDKDIHKEIDNLKKNIIDKKYKPRFIIVTDYNTLLAYDTKTEDSLDIRLLELDRHYDFFLPWVGMEKSEYLAENPADIKAAAKMAKLYDEIIKVNALETAEDRHYLNVFLTRLLFCYFAEDTNIFLSGIFTSSIKDHTKSDGSDLDNYLERIFEILNTEDRPKNTPAYLNKFPYVNGGLFKDNYPIPPFTAKARKILIEVGSLNWSEINPDIFGSMVQAVIATEHRAGLGMHYTSVPNIMKVITPLFLDELYQEFDKSFENVKKLKELIQRLANIKVFDPACGSANFLIIAYKKLRELEIAILQRIDILSPQKNMDFSQIRLDNFYGIEIDDFAHEVAILSMWLVEHQMNMRFYEAFGRTNPTLPLKAGGNIVAGNATRLDWEVVCPKNDGDEIYLLGNPPFYGKKEQSTSQKNEIKSLFSDVSSYGLLDYVSCWYLNAAKMITNTKSKCAFVSTNSIVQGEQSSILWNYIYSEFNVDIFFAYRTFKWKNNAKDNAAVSCVIIGMSGDICKDKKIYEHSKNDSSERVISVKNINNYLQDFRNIFISRRNKPLSKMPLMIEGITPLDNGILSFTEHEYLDFISKEPSSEKWFKKWITGNSFINGKSLFCLWLVGISQDELNSLKKVTSKVEQVRVFRENSKSSQKFATTPWLFRETTIKPNYIIVPKTSSDRREYIPVGYVENAITSSSSLILDTSEPYILGVISSKMHMTWVRAVAGKLKTDYRYSSTLVYNTFPFPDISQKQKDAITELVFNVLGERERHSEKTLAQLYDPDKMPAGLREAHHKLDLAIEQCYRKKPFESDEERLAYLFKMYEMMVGGEK